MEQNGDETETDGGTPEEGEGAIYTNSPPGGGSFEDRFSFQHKDLLPPPPVPTKVTLERRNMTGTKPKIKVPQSPPPRHSSPKTPTRGYDGDSSFESGIESITKVEAVDKDVSGSEVKYIMKDSMLLHDTLKTIAVQETTKATSNRTINRFICVTLILSNVLSCSISIMGTVIIYDHVMTPRYNNHPIDDGKHEGLHLDHHHLVQDVRVKDQSPVYLGQSQTSTSSNLDHHHGNKDQEPLNQDKTLPTLGKNLDRYKINIDVSRDNETEEDFWMD